MSSSQPAACPGGCVLAIVGSRDLEGDAAAAILIEEVLDIHTPCEVISGGARGIDTMAAGAARARAIPLKEFLPNTLSWTDPRGGFKERNEEIATYCECLVRISSSSTKTYGSGQCADFAESIGKRVTRIKVPKDDPFVGITSQTEDPHRMEAITKVLDELGIAVKAHDSVQIRGAIDALVEVIAKDALDGNT